MDLLKLKGKIILKYIDLLGFYLFLFSIKDC